MSKSGETFERAAEALAKVNGIAVTASEVNRQIQQVRAEIAKSNTSLENTVKETINARGEVLNAVGEIRSIEKEYRQSVAQLEMLISRMATTTSESLETMSRDVKKLRYRIVWQTVGLFVLATALAMITAWMVFPSIRAALGME